MSAGPASSVVASLYEALTDVLRLPTGASSSALFWQQVENQFELYWCKANLAKGL